MKKRVKIFKYLILSIIGFMVLFLLFFGGYSIIFAKKIYTNQYIGEINFSGKNKDQAKDILQDKTKEFIGKNIELKYTGKDGETRVYAIKPSDLGLQYNIDVTTDNLWHYGRTDNIFTSFWQQFRSVFQKNGHQSEYTINEDSINQKISEIASQVDNPEKDFSLSYSGGEFVLTSGRKEGERIDQNEIKATIKHQVSSIQGEEINFQSKVYKPQVDEAKAKKRLEEANGILKAGELAVEFEAQKFPADVDTIGSFIVSKIKGDDLEIAFNEDRLKIFVQNIAQNINVTPQNATLKVSGGKASVFQTARLGKTLDQVQTVVDIENALSARLPNSTSNASPTRIILKVEINKPEITDDTINNLGIIELVGTGMTDFKKSPVNRVHNINIGAAAINGTLVKPGETFSTLGRLGKIDASSGYLEELVIKENSTVPEFGGGLCQVSTTLFRATMNAGLKITERSNHKYRVSYYEPPAGMDATIYDPAPDFKFVNNYASYILIQAKVEGTKITFDIYGTKDGRVATVSNPEIYDTVEPGPAVMVETDTLPAGEKKQIEKSHQGASTKFFYKVIRGSETLQEKIFTSKYVAWPEKWLVGKGAAPVPPEVPPTPPVAPTPEPTPPAPEPETPAPPVDNSNVNTNS